MFDPKQLAQQERSQSQAITLAKRLQQEKAAESATTQTGFWRAFDPEKGLHQIELPDGSIVWAQSGVSTGFDNGAIVTVARAKGEQYARIRVRR